MRLRFWLLVPMLISACAHGPALTRPGYALAGQWSPGALFLSGGGPENQAVLGRFIALAGGTQASIVLMPFAQSEGQADNYRAALRALGCTALQTLSGAFEQQAQDRALLQHANAVFIEGGDVNRLAKREAPFASALRQAWLQGCVIGGDSAGAMVLGSAFIGLGERQGLLRQGLGGLSIGSGLAFLPGCMVDPHFTERSRFERLYLAASARKAHGIGIDEQTAATLSPNGTLSCYGVGAVTLLSPMDGAQILVKVLFSGTSTPLEGWLPSPQTVTLPGVTLPPSAVPTSALRAPPTGKDALVPRAPRMAQERPPQGGGTRVLVSREIPFTL